MVDGKKLSEVGFNYLGVPYSTMDCQAFVEKCLSDCGLKKNLAGSNAWYREVLNHGWCGTPEECVERYGCVPSGAFLFILKQDGKEPDRYKGDGIGNASHIGLCTGELGKGGIHSSSSKGCVCESEFHGKTIKGGWNRVGIYDEVDYGLQPSPTETATVYAANGLPVNLRKRPSRNSAIICKVPCGQQVDLLESSPDWCKVRWNGHTGYMMTEFLSSDGIPVTYCVVIHGLSKDEAETIAAGYPGAEVMEERG